MIDRCVYIRTFGCQMNKLDSALVASALAAAGFDLADKVSDADVVVINTCSVREHAEARVLSHLGHLKYLRKSRPELIVAVIGCMAQRLGKELLEHPAVDIVCGPTQIPRLPAMIDQARANPAADSELLAVTANIRRATAGPEIDSLDDFERLHDMEDCDISGQAYVRAMHGCNRFCAYCVVPYVRGPEISRPPQAIRDQICRLADKGIMQITLLGQTVNSYTYAAGGKTWRLADLLEMAAAVDGIHWVRFVTSYPADFDEAIFHAMADIDGVCPYLHIPAQSGSDRILKAMNRHYTAAEYLALLEKARDIVPNIAIAGDFIVGFPGETAEDFQSTCNLLVGAQYKNAFIFKYSPRPGTRADKTLADDVPAKVKKERNMQLLELQNSVSAELNKRLVGSTLEVLVEGPAKKAHLDGPHSALPQLTGRTATDHIAVFSGPLSLAGSFATVKITRASSLTLFGELLEA